MTPAEQQILDAALAWNVARLHLIGCEMQETERRRRTPEEAERIRDARVQAGSAYAVAAQTLGYAADALENERRNRPTPPTQVAA